MTAALRARLTRIQLAALIIGLVAIGVSTFGAFTNTRQFFYSYLFGLLFWFGLSHGCLLVGMIHQLTGGRWGYPTRRFFEAGFTILPLLLVLFIPVFLGLHQLYPWARPSDVLADPVLQQRIKYENPPGFIGRTIFWFVIWITMAWSLRKWSLQQDATTDAAPTRKARTLSGIGLVISALMATFAYVDWIMSLEKHWYSTMFAVILMGGQILTTFAFGVVLLTLFKGQEPISSIVTKTHYHHLGNLMLTFVLFWTYVSFGQLLIIYSGDIPHEVDWYLHRIADHWKFIVGAIGLFHFFLPFFLLLFRAVKCRVAAMTVLAAIVFIIHILEVYWLVMPSFHQTGPRISWLDFTAPLGIGGLWVSAFLYRLKSAALAPQHDPGLQFAFTYAK